MRRNILQEIAENAPPPGATEDVPDGFFHTFLFYPCIVKESFPPTRNTNNY